MFTIRRQRFKNTSCLVYYGLSRLSYNTVLMFARLIERYRGRRGHVLSPPIQEGALPCLIQKTTGLVSLFYNRTHVFLFARRASSHPRRELCTSPRASHNRTTTGTLHRIGRHSTNPNKKSFPLPLFNFMDDTQGSQSRKSTHKNVDVKTNIIGESVQRRVRKHFPFVKSLRDKSN